MMTTIVLVVVMGGIFLLMNQQDITGRIVEDSYTHTKAICNETEKGSIYCEDYEITCKGNETINSIATGFSVFHEEGWEDPRGEDGSERLCE